MSNSVVANRYAIALFQIAKEKQLLEQMEEDLRVVKEVVSKTTELLGVFKSPKLSNIQKQQLVKETFTAVNPYVLNTLLILIERHREDEIVHVADKFIQLADSEKGVAEAVVTSVRPLSDDEQKALSSAFAAKVGKQSLRITNIIDSKLLGGIKLRIGNRIFDGSIEGKLNRLERQLIG